MFTNNLRAIALAALAAGLFGIPACSGEDNGDSRHFEYDIVEQTLPKGTAGAQNGQGDYCTGGDLCLAGEGDCDRDSECQGTLVCGYDNLINFLPSACNGCDACVRPHCRNGRQDIDETGVDCGGADCGSCPGCPTAPDGDPDHCTNACPCPAGEADCDTNSNCNTGLVCGLDLGPQFGYPAGHDVCVQPHCTNGVQDTDETGVDCGGSDCGTCRTCPANGQNNTCSPSCRCASGWGDCDANGECESGLVCGGSLGAQFGMNPSFDVCVPPHCTNGQQDSAEGEEGVDCGGSCGTCAWGSQAATSCAAGDLDICGTLGTENCCASPKVGGGTFIRNYDGVILTNSTNKSAAVSSYHLDKFEVTVGRFRKFVADFDVWRGAGNPSSGAGAHPRVASSGWDASWPLAADAATLAANLKCAPKYQTWTDSAGANEARPINCVNWYESFAFCLWDNGRLATEAEHNAAAAGGTDQRVYPWSSPATSTSISFSDAHYACGGDGCSGSPAELLVVGSLPDGAARWGHMDLSGNVWEFTLDYYKSSLPFPCSDCANVTQTSAWRVIRGGSWATNNSDHVTAGWRDRGAIESRLAHVGFRCARD